MPKKANKQVNKDKWSSENDSKRCLEFILQAVEEENFHIYKRLFNTKFEDKIIDEKEEKECLDMIAQTKEQYFENDLKSRYDILVSLASATTANIIQWTKRAIKDQNEEVRQKIKGEPVQPSEELIK